MLLSVSHLTKAYGPHLVLSDLTFTLNAGERAGIVGLNGTGKSTLLRILAREEAPDDGTITYAPSLAIGYLPQALPAFAGQTLDDLLREALGELQRIEAHMRELEATMASTADDALPALLDEYGALSTRYQDRGGYALDHTLAEVLAGLRLDYLPRDADVGTLSGGERTRLGLARLLLAAPDLLLLDEPTNHLDVATLAWLEDYLARYRGGVALVSHDRRFLNRAVTRLFELDEHTHTLKLYTGNYDAYVAVKARERAAWEEGYQRQQDELRELRKRMREAPHQIAHNRPPRDSFKAHYKAHGELVARAVSSTIRAAEERLRRIETDPIPKPPKPLGFYLNLAAERLQANVILAAEGLTKRYGSRTLLDGVSFAVLPGARILLSGPNGAGKTTLLRLLLGREAPDAGQVQRAPGVRTGYLPQMPELPAPERTVFEVYRDGLAGTEAALTASLLGQGNFRLEDLSKQVSQLSIGQQRKLEVARLIAARPNVLLLDEPTNHLSLDIVEGFEAALAQFPGPILAVSHDRTFVERFGGEVWELAGGALLHRGAGAPPAQATPLR